ncbi:NlpC/P60 family protein [Curtobacterium sp. MCLR17_036]|uniref:C40 family peptidase n=1 Tax=Curtobacterium sp. MCLR17_036 TaxID=2175620 RepID=UPI000DA7949F|nr:C40 family peptidase [Curtobacterium sp. MCLR17_036]WIE66189.1 NlpC/P60 family protein [Curtobacterium sp. MCLR17_036]
MGRHALAAAAVDDHQPARATPNAVSAPVRQATQATRSGQPLRPRGRRSALGPAAARSTFVEHPAPARTVRMQPRPTVTSSAGAAVLSRTAALRAERAADPRHLRRAANAKRAAVLLAPALAVTSSLTLALPANAATPDDSAQQGTTTSQSVPSAQSFTVAHDVEVPVVSTDGMTTTTTIVSYPTLDLRFGVTTAQAQSALSAALSGGGDRATIVATALQYMGDPYVEGGASHEGIDCSGLTMVAYAAVGIPLVHYVPTQDAAATTIPESEALPGDLVVYDDEDHVGLYLGQGLVLQAPHPGEVVDIVPMYSAAHHFARVLPAGS